MVPVVWFTGLSGSGKSTIASGVADELRKRGMPVEILDGDVMRTNLGKELGFCPEARRENLERISFVACLLNRHGVVVLVPAISPYREVRDEIRRSHLCFIEVFVNAPLSVCEQRDPKGLYRRARSGEIKCFTGISDKYEGPAQPDVECKTDLETPEVSCARVIDAIERILESAQTQVALNSQPNALAAKMLA